MDPMDIIRTAQERRAARCLVSQSGIPCPTEAWRDYYNERDASPRDQHGRIFSSPKLRRLKAAAIASTSH